MKKEKTFRILIVDDIFSNIYLVLHLLESNGYVADYAMNAQDAMKNLQERKYDLILLDILMPEVSGIDLFKQIKEDKYIKSTPVIFLTGVKDVQQLSDAFKMGAVDYITKPFNIDEVLARVQTHIKLTESQKQLKKELKKRKKIHARLQQSELKFRTLVENSHVAISISTFEGKIIEANPAMAQFLGYSVTELPEINFYQLFCTKIARHEIIKQLKTDGLIKDFEIELIKKDGTPLYCLLTSGLITLKNTKYIQTVLIDITAQLETEKKILRASITAEENERRRLSQELHDGLSPILLSTKLYIEAMQNTNEKEKIQNFSKYAMQSIEEATNAATEISYKISPHILTNFGLITALNQFIERIREAYPIQINFHTKTNNRFDSYTEVVIYRIMLELINNTLKYARATQIDITIFLAHNNLNLEYLDNGKGFDIQKTLAQNKGMGLYNIQNRVYSIKGEIKFESEPDKGFKSVINIPAVYFNE